MRPTYFTNATPGSHKPRSTVNHFGGSLGGPILRDKLFFFVDSEWVRIALPIVTPVPLPTTAFQNYVLQQLPLGGVDAVTGLRLPRRAADGAVLPGMFSLYGNTAGTPLAVLGCPFNADGSKAAGNPANGNGCANRQSVSHSSDDHEQVQTARLDYNLDPTTPPGFAFRPTPACKLPTPTPSIRLFNAVSPQPLYSFAAGLYARLFQNLVNYFNPGFSWYSEHFRAQRLPEDARGFSDRARRAAVRMRPSLHWEGWTTHGRRDDEPPVSSSMTISPGATAPTSLGSARTPGFSA